MVQKPDVILGPNGLPVWQCDPGTGNTAQAGTLTALDLVVPIEASPSVPAPGYLKLYSPDGQALSLLSPADVASPISLPPAFATVAFSPATVTGATTIQALASGITVPAGGLAAGQIYHVVAWGVLTTATAETVTFGLHYGGTAGVDLLDFGSQTPGTQSGATWMCQWDVQITGATTATAGGFNGPAFSPQTLNQKNSTGLSAAAAAFTVTVTPSATDVSVTLNGGYCERIK